MENIFIQWLCGEEMFKPLLGESSLITTIIDTLTSIIDIGIDNTFNIRFWD